MDPASVVGIASGIVALLKTILEGSLGLQSALREIKSIDETTDGLAGEVDAFRFLLLHLETEIQTSKLILDVGKWWDPVKLKELLANVLKTFARLDNIVKDVGKQRNVLSSLRQYWRSKSYDKEIQNLRLRIGTYTAALRIPIELGNM